MLEDYEFLEVGAGTQAPALAEYEAGIHEKHVQQTPQTPKERKRNPIELQVCDPFFWAFTLYLYTVFARILSEELLLVNDVFRSCLL